MKRILVVLISIIVVPLSITNFFYDYKVKKMGIVTNIVEKQEAKEEKIIRVLRGETIENIPLEEYLVGVVSSEVPVYFEEEALKAQAVAARTYALKQIQNRTNEDYDVTDTTSSQVYKSIDELKNIWQDSFEENYTKIKTAIEKTKGEYLTYDGEVIYAFFFSTSNGKTEDNKDVFGADLPYLKIVDSSFDESETSNFTTSKEFTLEEFYQLLGIEYNDNLDIKDVVRTDSNRVKSLTVNNNTYSGREFQSKLSLRSNDFTVEKNNENITITTKGYGHGVGMSQYGAKELANNGYKYDEILKHYYQGVEFKKI